MNKQLLQIEEEAEQLFVNQFGNTDHKKTALGVQQLYLIGIIFEIHYFFNDMLIGFSFFTGLYDSIPVQETLEVLEKFLPSILFIELKKYVTAECDSVRSHIDWDFFQHKLEKLNLDTCANHLINLFEKRNLSEDQIKIFHISTNMTSNDYTEPTSKNTTKMVYQFLMYIYQRNIIASLVKYILLNNI